MGASSSRQGGQTTTEDARGQKRKLEDDSSEDNLLNTPKKRKVKSTSKYIFDRLFVKGESSDVTIRALGRTWELHRVYLCQADYFRSMFNGSWRESTSRVIDIDIADGNVDANAMHIALGSLYRDDISIKATECIPVLAVSMLLGMEGLAQQCLEIMIETISPLTVCSYHLAATMYGQVELAKKCVQWLERNLMTLQTPQLLRDIRPELLQEVVSSPDLLVIQIEMDIYLMLKKWLYLQFQPNGCENNETNLTKEADDFFKLQRSVNKTEFLLTRPGHPYIHVFSKLRYQYIINDLVAVGCLKKDFIIPHVWLQLVITQQWTHMLKMEQGLDKGPTDEHFSEFPGTCIRVGRVLHNDAHYCWRWTGYNYGVDILINLTNRMFSLRRNVLSEGFLGSHSAQKKRNIIYKVSVISFGARGQVLDQRTTGVRLGVFGKDEEVLLFSLDRKFRFPVHLSASFLVYSPKAFKPLVIPDIRCDIDEPLPSSSSLKQTDPQTDFSMQTDSQEVTLDPTNRPSTSQGQEAEGEDGIEEEGEDEDELPSENETPEDNS